MLAVAEEHACIELRKGRLYCTALVGDPDNFMDDTFTWLNDSEIRPGLTNCPLCSLGCIASCQHVVARARGGVWKTLLSHVSITNRTWKMTCLQLAAK